MGVDYTTHAAEHLAMAGVNRLEVRLGIGAGVKVVRKDRNNTGIEKADFRWQRDMFVMKPEFPERGETFLCFAGTATHIKVRAQDGSQFFD